MRLEHDFLGELELADDVLYGVQSARGMRNFRLSGEKLKDFPELVKALAKVKKAAALANCELKLLPENIKDAICLACDELIEGKHLEHFLVDMIQGGAGTSSNMNANEVIANLALLKLGKKPGQYEFCHPNNHVNLGQSTNDAYPTAIKIALFHHANKLLEAAKTLEASFSKKAEELKDAIKMGRTHLQDAVPITLGREFKSYANALASEIEGIKTAQNGLLYMNMGATAVGTGINSHPKYAKAVEAHLQRISGLKLESSQDLVEGTWNTASFLRLSSSLKCLAATLSKICNDLRLMASGPRCGLGEINLPQMQPGSSIMPGKVNPVIPEVVGQVCFYVIGADSTVALACSAAQLELNVFEPVAAYSLLKSLLMLESACASLANDCVKGISANKEHCENVVKNSVGIITALNPYIGYEKAAALAKEAMSTGKSTYDLVLAQNLLPKEKLDEILSPEFMLTPRMESVN